MLQLLKDIMVNGTYYRNKNVIIEGLKVLSMLVYNLKPGGNMCGLKKF